MTEAVIRQKHHEFLSKAESGLLFQSKIPNKKVEHFGVIHMHESDISLSRNLRRAALAAWCISLALPGFIVATRTESYTSGLEILVTGTLFGWMVNGWAVYANFFFLAAAIYLSSNKTPVKSVVFMLFLAATLPLFRGVIQDEGSGTILPVVSWGWGAILWLLSLVLLAMAAAVHGGVLHRLHVKLLGLAIGVTVIALGIVHIQQTRNANLQEKDMFLSKGMAFTNAEFCGVPFVWPTEALVPPGELIKLDVEPKYLNSNKSTPFFWQPTFARYEDAGFDWVSYPHINQIYTGITVRTPAKPKKFVLQLQSTEEGAVIKLRNEQTNATVYEQRLRIRRGTFNYPKFCPEARGALGYSNAILRAVGQDPTDRYPKEILRNETARVPCNLGTTPIDGTKGRETLLTWDGRVVNLQPESIRNRIGFCSDSYIGLLYVFENSASSTAGLSPVVMLYDRNSLRPIANFNDGLTCSGMRCGEAPKDILLGFRIEGDSAIVETTQGELISKRLNDEIVKR